jgi:tellurite resistance protein TerC
MPWRSRLLRSCAAIRLEELVNNSIDVGIWGWLAFNGVVLGLLALDLGVFNRKAHAPSLKEAAGWSAAWITLSMLFAAGIFIFAGGDAGVSFLTGYLIEYSLSVDNIFVFVLIFGYFSVPAAYQHRVLFWGILGALVMRGLLIGVGSALLHEFHWLIYIFGAVLILSGVRMATQGERAIDMNRNLAVRLFCRLMRVTTDFREQCFFVRENGALFATPLVLVLLVVETTDLIFAVDSIPAIFAVTSDPFLVYTSNVCAILGLRSLYFLLAGVADKLYYLKPALSMVLVWVGSKMLLTEVYKVPTTLSLLVIAVILGTAVVTSLMTAEARERKAMLTSSHRLLEDTSEA